MAGGLDGLGCHIALESWTKPQPVEASSLITPRKMNGDGRAGSSGCVLENINLAGRWYHDFMPSWSVNLSWTIYRIWRISFSLKSALLSIQAEFFSPSMNYTVRVNCSEIVFGVGDHVNCILYARCSLDPSKDISGLSWRLQILMIWMSFNNLIHDAFYILSCMSSRHPQT